MFTNAKIAVPLGIAALTLVLVVAVMLIFGADSIKDLVGVRSSQPGGSQLTAEPAVAPLTEPTGKVVDVENALLQDALSEEALLEGTDEVGNLLLEEDLTSDLDELYDESEF